MATTEEKLTALAAKDAELAAQHDRDASELAVASAAFTSGQLHKPEATATVRPPLGSGHYAAKGALAEAEMNERFTRERETEAKARQKSQSILQKIVNFFYKIAKKIRDFFSSKNKTAAHSSARPIPPAEPVSLADQVMRGVQAEARFHARVAQRRKAEEEADKNIVPKIWYYFYQSKKSTQAQPDSAADKVTTLTVSI